VRWTARHYVDFGDAAEAVGGELASHEAWDRLRLEADLESPYALPPDRATWLSRSQQNPEIVQRARAIVELLSRLGVRGVFSAGVGSGWLEYNIKRSAPWLHISCSDYAPRSIQRLREVFVECDRVFVFDMLHDEWPLGEDLALLHRVDTEFSDREWLTVFDNMSRSAIAYVLFIPSCFLNIRSWLMEKLRLLSVALLRGRYTFAGYLRTRATFSELWARGYLLREQVVIGDLVGFLLEHRGKEPGPGA